MHYTSGGYHQPGKRSANRPAQSATPPVRSTPTARRWQKMLKQLPL
ncbi:hypothetical protein GIX45_18740 [Erwinia sp. CPCC 100877]|nr:hypothetical protein [Erwinia sp. CPCC 100877]